MRTVCGREFQTDGAKISLLTDASSSVLLVHRKHCYVAAYQIVLVDMQLTDDGTNASVYIQRLNHKQININVCHAMCNVHYQRPCSLVYGIEPNTKLPKKRLMTRLITSLSIQLLNHTWKGYQTIATYHVAKCYFATSQLANVITNV